MPSVDIDASFARFVYPFLFEPETFKERSDTAEWATWEGRKRDFPVWDRQSFPVEDALPYVADYLNPPFGPGGKEATACLWTMPQATIEAFDGLGGKAEWALRSPRGEMPFTVDGVQLALFGTGVGFLTVCTRLETTKVEDWLDFLHTFRFVRGQREVVVSAQRQVARDQFEAFFPEQAGGVARLTDGAGHFGEVIAALLRTASAPGDPEKWWHDAFVPDQLLPYAALFVDELPETEIPHLLYRARNFFHPGQGGHPAAADLKVDGNPGLIPYDAGQWFTFSLDGGAFVACDAPKTHFARVTVPEHLGGEYFLLFLLALHQRFTLIMLSSAVAEHWAKDHGAADHAALEGAVERIRDTFLAFTARGYFAQVMQREHHHRVYRHWQTTFQTERLYRDVSNAIREMHGHVMLHRAAELERLQREEQDRDKRAQEQTRQLERRVSLLALVLGGPALVLTYIDATGTVGRLAGIGLAIAGFLTGVALLAVLNAWSRRR